MRKTPRTVGKGRTLVCPCGKVYTGSNPRLVNKLFFLHVSMAHNEKISENDVNMISYGPSNVGFSKNNPKMMNQDITVHNKRNDMIAGLQQAIC